VLRNRQQKHTANPLPPSVGDSTIQTICYLKTEKEKRQNEQPTHKTAHSQAPTHKPMLRLQKSSFLANTPTATLNEKNNL